MTDYEIYLKEYYRLKQKKEEAGISLRDVEMQPFSEAHFKMNKKAYINTYGEQPNVNYNKKTAQFQMYQITMRQAEAMKKGIDLTYGEDVDAETLALKGGDENFWKNIETFKNSTAAQVEAAEKGITVNKLIAQVYFGSP